MYVYVRFVIGLFFLLCALGSPWANYSVVFPEKVQQSRCLVTTLLTEHRISFRQDF